MKLYDSDLNELKTSTDRHLIESILLTKSHVVCTYAHKSNECCRVYDHNFNDTGSFGQQTDSEGAFYLEKLPLNKKDYKAKLNPIIFGYDEGRVYFHDKKEMVMMCRRTGQVLSSVMKRNENLSFFLADGNNILEIDHVCKTIGFWNSEFDVRSSGTYNLEANSVVLIEGSFLAFINNNQQCVTVV